MKWRLLLVAGLTIAVAACAPDEPQRLPVTQVDDSLLSALPDDGTQTLSIVNGVPISEGLLDAFYAIRGSDREQLPPPSALQELEDLLLIVQHHEDHQSDFAVRDQQQLLQQLLLQQASLLANQAVPRATQNQVDLSDEALRAEYDRQIARADAREFNLEHAIFPNQVAAEAAMAAAGDDFAAVIANEAAEQAGQLGWVDLTQLPPPVASQVANLAPGAVTAAPVASRYGWHLIKVIETRPLTPPDFEQVKQGIAASMRNQAIAQFLINLRQSGTVRRSSAAPIPANVGDSAAEAPSETETSS